MTRQAIYLDHAATAPLHPAACEAMAEALSSWYNPSSPHAEGRAAKAELERARERIANALEWGGRIIFTSGASEAIAIALQRAKAKTRFISAVEHDAISRAAPEAVVLPVDEAGRADVSSITKNAMVAVQHANNETGVLQPLEDIAAEVREKGGLLLADCAQTAGKLPLPDADFIAISAHKFGGPPGVGALLLRNLGHLEAVGGQEQGYRPGTENLPGIIGMAAALEASDPWMERADRLRRRLEKGIVVAGGEVVAAQSPRIPTIGAYRMTGVGSDAQLIQFDMAGLAVSAGSACSSGSLKPSRVLSAMGWPEEAAREVVRVSFGPSTTEEEVNRFTEIWAEMASRKRAA
jgi:cysteine desulfurase